MLFTNLFMSDTFARVNPLEDKLEDTKASVAMTLIFERCISDQNVISVTYVTL